MTAPFDPRRRGIEIFRWPPEGPLRSRVIGVLALYRPRQIAVVADAAPTYAANRDAAVERVVQVSMLDLLAEHPNAPRWGQPEDPTSGGAWLETFRTAAPRLLANTRERSETMSNPDPDPAGDVDRFIRRAIAGALRFLGNLPASGRGAAPPAAPPPAPAPTSPPSALELAILDALDFVRASWRAHRDPVALRRHLLTIVGELDRLVGR